MMTTFHRIAVVSKSVVAIIVLGVITFGAKTNLSPITASDTSLRQIGISLWAFGLPFWFLFENAVFAPAEDNVEAHKSFRKNQNTANLLWTFLSAVVAIVIGVSPADLSKRDAPSPAAAIEQQKAP